MLPIDSGPADLPGACLSTRGSLTPADWAPCCRAAAWLQVGTSIALALIDRVGRKKLLVWGEPGLEV